VAQVTCNAKTHKQPVFFLRVLNHTQESKSRI